MLLEKYVKLLKSKLNDKIEDILIFGSTVKGGLRPKDTDILVVCRDDSKPSLVRRMFDDLPEKFQVTVTKKTDLLKTHTLLKQAAVHEGFSIKFGKPLREVLGFNSYTLFTFSLKNLNSSDKVRFQYALYGRGKKTGVLEENQGRQVSPGAILIPVNKEREVEDFFRNWKTHYKKERWMIDIK